MTAREFIDELEAADIAGQINLDMALRSNGQDLVDFERDGRFIVLVFG